MSTTDTDAVLHEDRDERGVVTLTLNRPQVRNAFDDRLLSALTEAATRLGADETVRAVVLTGAGTAFCAGADLNWMRSTADATAGETDDSSSFEDMLRAVHELPMPVLARVNGHALAGASGLLGCADIAIAVRGARFGFTEARLGLVPAMISAYVLPRIGVTHATRYFLTAEVFDSDRAREIGLVDEVCETEELDAVLGEMLERVVAAGGAAQREIKRLVPSVATARPQDSEQLRLDSIARARVSEEAQTRIAAFLSERG
ncbi:MAG: enoyl-CoA hydratase-related protein [Nitriliruptoraceae bacterium]